MIEHQITQETRARNTLYWSRTMNLIKNYIYEQTECENCKSGNFCSRDGDKWGCLTYGNIASHLNHIGHPTSRGNKWSGKTIRDQVTWGMKKVSPEKKIVWQKEQDRIRDNQVIWGTIPKTIFEDNTNVQELMQRVELMSNIENIEDVQSFTDELREHLTKKVGLGLELTLFLIHSEPRG